MKQKLADIDIDVSPNTDKDQYGVRAIIYDNDKKRIKPHPSGFYMPEDEIPVDPVTGYAAIDYEDAEELGFQKIDLLTNTIYKHFHSKMDVLHTLNKEPNWDKLLDEKFVSKLPQIANHYDILVLIKPKSVQELADVLALIRPGKKHLIDDYLKDKERTRINLYRRPKTGYMFKKSHAIAYAAMIVCYMNRLDFMKRFVS